jgi:hypothetical protein
MRKLIAAMVFVLILSIPVFCQDEKEAKQDAQKERELKACGSKENEVKYVADTDKNSHPTGTQAADSALIYVIRSMMLGNKVQTKLAVDGEWKGVNRGNNYFFFNLQPGEHYFCSRAENKSILVLAVEAGKTYYLEQSIHMGLMKARNDLNVMENSDGENKLTKAHPSTWEIDK